MSDLNGILPEGFVWRELWFPELINSQASLPSSKDGGQLLTLTGARKGTTVDGAHGVPGVDTSNINLGTIHDNENILWVSFRFKLDQDFSVAAGTDQYLWGKWDDGTNYVMCWLEADDGKLYMAHREGNGAQTIISTEDSWTAGVWYHVIVSCHNVNGQRLIVDGGTPVVEAGNTDAISLTADFCLLARDDGTSTEGLAGTMVDVVMGNIVLTQTADTGEEALLCKGIPPVDATESYRLDEGRGTATVDRGTGGNDGTLDTSVTWDWGTVKLAALSLDGRNDDGTSDAGVDISGDLTLIVVVKAKSTYTTLAADHDMVRIRVDDNNLIKLEYENTADAIRWHVIGDSTAIDVDYTIRPSIDDYLIFVGTYDGETAVFYVNGDYIGLAASGEGVSGAAAIAYIGATETPDQWDVSKPLLVGLASGVLSGEEAQEVSRRINNRLSLGLTIP